jgi:hypothetical protein
MDVTKGDFLSIKHDIEIKIIESFYEGMRQGIKRFAVWQDGIQVVGSGVITQKEALAEVDRIEKSEKDEVSTS